MTELEELLHKAGHRPAPHGKRWICADCPPGHFPALCVDGEVFFCHRCGRGGNVVILKKSLGLWKASEPVSPIEQLERNCFRSLRAEAERILDYWRVEIMNRHRFVSQQLEGLRKIGAYQCETQSYPDEQVLLAAHEFSERQRLLAAQLDFLENLKPEDLYDLAEQSFLWGDPCPPSIESLMNSAAALPPPNVPPEPQPDQPPSLLVL